MVAGACLPPAATAGPLSFDKSQVNDAVWSAILGTSADAVAGAFRGYLVKTLPVVLYEDSPNWGHQANVLKRIDLKKGSGSHLRFEKEYALKNHGVWRKVQVRAPDLADTLVVDLRHVTRPDSGRLTFDVFLSIDTLIEYEQQTWANGLRLYSGSATVDARIKLNLKCEVTTRLEKSTTVVPDLILGFRVLDAHLNFDNLNTEHIAGVGGEAARVLGDAVKGGLDKWKPEMQQGLLAKADAAIVKAGESKEVRLSLSDWIEGKK
jgi:hypothetical protein